MGKSRYSREYNFAYIFIFQYLGGSAAARINSSHMLCWLVSSVMEEGTVFKNRWTRQSLVVSSFIVFCAVVYALVTGCATTATTQKTTVDPVREKAIQDSLKQIWDRKLNIAWSTGFENHKNKLYQDAVKPFWRVVELDTVKRFQDLYTFLGDCYLKLDKPDSAEMVYRLGTVAYPEKAFYHRSLAWLLAGRSQSDEAILEYRKAIELEPGKPTDYKSLGGLLVAADLPQEALPVYQKLLELDPGDTESQKVVSQILSSLGDIDAALQSWEKALASDPNNTTVLMNLGETYFKEQRWSEAVKPLTTLVGIKPDDAYALELLGNSQQNLGKPREAIAVYEKILALKPDNKKILCEMANCYKELKQFAKARSIANQAMKIDSNYGLVYIVRGDIYAASADDCINQRSKKVSKFDDKLVYRLAYDEYAKAVHDVQFTDEAKRKMNYIQLDIPTKEDLFMNKSRTTINTTDYPCYAWIR